jgi:hypothetical protein
MLLHSCFYRFIVFVLSTCLLSACIRENTPERIGIAQAAFANTQATLPIGDTLLLEVILSRNAAQDLSIPVFFEGEAALNEAFASLDGTSVFIERGKSVGFIRLVTLPAAVAGEGFAVRLDESEGIQIRTERSSAQVTFLVRHSVNLNIWAPDISLPQLYGYTSFGSQPVASDKSGEHFAFAHKSQTQQNVIGFFNTLSSTASTNAFNMHRLYQDFGVSSGSANIRIPSCLLFIPSSPGANSGTVEVIDQWVNITRTSASGLPLFQVRIWGEGTYSEASGRIELAVYFDESAIGGDAAVLRRYVYERQRRN